MRATAVLCVIIVLAGFGGGRACAQGKRRGQARFRMGFPVKQFGDIREPRTRGEVHEKYNWLVDASDGIDKREAFLTAQKEAVDRELYRDYDWRKPRVHGETSGEWKIGLPGKFSLTSNSVAGLYIVCVDKKNGEVSCSRSLSLEGKIPSSSGE